MSQPARAALFHLLAFGLPPGEHLLGYPVPGQDDDLRRGHRRYNFVWYRRVDEARLADMQTDSAGTLHAGGIAPQAIRPDVIDGLYRDADALLAPAFAEAIRVTEMPLFQPIGDLESPRIAFGRIAILGDAAFVARPHVAQGAIKAGYDAMELAAALDAEPTVEAALTRYDAVRRPAGQRVVDNSRRLGAYLEGKLGSIERDPAQVMRENGGVNPADAAADGGLCVRLLAEARFG